MKSKPLFIALTISLAALTILLLSSGLAAAAGCCVNQGLNDCSPADNADSCAGIFYARECSNVAGCELVCCCQGANSVWQTPSPAMGCTPPSYTASPDADGNCPSSLCTGTPETFNVTGKVFNASSTPPSPLSNALVSAAGGGSAYTASDGGYALLRLTRGVYTLTASHSGCIDNSTTVNLDSNKAVDLYLRCGSTPPPACVEDNYCNVTAGETCGNCPSDCCATTEVFEVCSASTANYVRLYKAEQVLNARQIDLAWELNATCNPGETVYYVERNDSGSFASIDTTPLLSYPDHSVKPGTSYSYRVRAVFPDGSEMFSNVLTVTVGDEECIGRDDSPFCSKHNEVAVCNDNKVEVVDDCNINNEKCALLDSGPACVSMAECEQCNWLYGVMPYLDFRISYTTAQGYVENIKCSDLADTYKVCYTDYSDTVVDPYKSCGEVASCNDYLSEQACAGDPCLLQEQCTWISVYHSLNKTGLGICVSKDDSCSSCNSLPGGCDRYKCETLGDCYYNDTSCLPFKEVTCNDYHSEEDCTGSRRVRVDASYAVDASGAVKRVSGTHRLTPSLDKAGLEKCYWDDSAYACYKDADNYTSTYEKDDCSAADLVCRRDFEAPNTTLFWNPSARLGLGGSIAYSAADNAYSDLDTYYCFNDSGCDYPAFLANPSEGFKLPVGPGFFGNLTLYYYSEDGSHNLERVKNQTVTADTKPPVMSFSYSYNSVFTGSGYASDLTGTVTASDESEPVLCWWNLTLSGSIVDSGRSSTNGFTFSESGLSDGLYYLQVKCRDNAFNQHFESYSVRIQGDQSLNNFQPNGTLNESLLSAAKLLVNTSYNGNCRFDNDTSTYADMDYSFATTGGRVHASPLPSTETGVYSYNVACQLQSPGGVVTVQDNPAHRIVFAIDKEAPNTLVSVTTYPSNRVFPEKVQWVSVTLTCNDSRPELFQGRDWSFGCDQVYFCNTTGCTPSGTGTDAFTFQLNTGGEQRVWYYSADKGGNKEPVKSMTFSIDNSPPSISITHSTTSFKEGSAWKSNLSFQVSLDEPANCSFEMTGQQTISTGRFDTSFSINYSGLSDGSYAFKATCRDVADNELERELSLNVDAANNWIYNASPSGTVNESPVIVSIDTLLGGECRYSATETKYSLMSDSFAGTGRHHSAALDLSTGIYNYHTACELINATNNQRFIVQGNSLDDVSFAVDLSPPMANLTITTVPSTPSPGDPVRQATLHFICVDEDSRLQGRDFGPGELYFCEGVGCAPQAQGDVTATVTIDQSGSKEVSYYCVDLGGNKEQVRTLSLSIDADPPSVALDYSVSTRVTSSGAVNDLSLSVQSSEPGSCTVTVSSNPSACSTPGYSNSTTVSSAAFTLTYPDLPEGCYKAEAVCSDIVGNERSESIDFEVRPADSLIYAKKPHLEVLNMTSTILALNTTLNGTCRYSKTTRLFDQMTNSFAGNKYHYSTLSGLSSGKQVYHVACSLRNGSTDVKVEDDPSYDIVFYVDLEPPFTNVSINSEPSFTPARSKYRKAELSLSCIDKPFSLDVKFGCASTTACVTNTSSCSRTSQTTFLLNETGTWKLVYGSLDNGGNSEQEKQLTLVIDADPPVFESMDVEAPPEFFDSAQQLTISSSDSGTIVGKASPDTVKICVNNKLLQQGSSCISKCPGQPRCIASDGSFSIDFDIAQKATETMNDIEVNATDEVGNVMSTTLKVLSDTTPPNPPTFTLEAGNGAP